MIKTIYKNPRANVTFNIEKLEAFTLRSSTKNGYSHLTLLFNTALEVLANTIKEQQQKKVCRWEKEDIKLSFITDDIIVFVDNLKELTKISGTNK